MINVRRVQPNYTNVSLVMYRPVRVLIFVGCPLNYAVIRGTVVCDKSDSSIWDFKDRRGIDYVSKNYSEKYSCVLAFTCDAYSVALFVV